MRGGTKTIRVMDVGHRQSSNPHLRSASFCRYEGPAPLTDEIIPKGLVTGLRSLPCAVFEFPATSDISRKGSGLSGGLSRVTERMTSPHPSQLFHVVLTTASV